MSQEDSAGYTGCGTKEKKSVIDPRIESLIKLSCTFMTPKR